MAKQPEPTPNSIGLADLEERWNEHARDIHPGMTSALWNDGKPFVSPRQMEAQAKVLEHGEMLPKMIDRYAEACKDGHRAWVQKDFMTKRTLGDIRLWVTNGKPPFWVKGSKVNGATSSVKKIDGWGDSR